MTRRTFEQHDNNDDPVFGPIHALLRKKRYDAALAQIYDKKFKRLRPPYSKDGNHGWYIVGDILYKNGKLVDAVVAFRKSVKCDKADAQALWALGNSYSAMDRPLLAERYFRRALETAAKGDRAKLVYNLGNALFDQAKYHAAISEYRKIGKSNARLFSMARKNIVKATQKMAIERSAGKRSE